MAPHIRGAVLSCHSGAMGRAVNVDLGAILELSDTLAEVEGKVRMERITGSTDGSLAAYVEATVAMSAARAIGNLITCMRPELS